MRSQNLAGYICLQLETADFPILVDVALCSIRTPRTARLFRHGYAVTDTGLFADSVSQIESWCRQTHAAKFDYQQLDCAQSRLS